MRFEDFNFLELMMTSSNGNIIRVTGPVCGESTGHRWIPLSKASNVEHWCYLRSRINGRVDHRPHTRQVTGARCTGGRGSPVMSWILLKANNAQQASGVGDKRFFRFKRNVQHCEQPLYDIMLMILNTNKWCVLISDQNLQMFFKSIWKIPSASGHSRSPFTSCRTRPSWHNGSSLGPHVLNGYRSMTLATTNTIYGKRDPALVDMWGTSYQNMKYRSSLRRRVITGGSEKAARVSRRMDCELVWLNFMSVPIIKK